MLTGGSILHKSRSDYNWVKMPFGKYKGILVKDVPIDYLKWFFLDIDLIKYSPIDIAISQQLTAKLGVKEFWSLQTEKETKK